MDATVENPTHPWTPRSLCRGGCAASETGGADGGPEQGDSFWIDKLPEWCEIAGFPKAEPFTPDRWADDGDTVTVGEQTLEVIHCPGHTPGHVVFLHRETQLAGWVM